MENVLKNGDIAPDFTLKETEGKEISLSSFLGKNIILYFYPKDNTPGCTKEACDFRDNYEIYKEKDTVIIGVSKDDLDSHKKFAEKYSLPFLLLADTDLTVSKLYGVWKEKVNFGKRYMGIERTTFLIDKKGLITKIFKRVKVQGHSEKIISLL